MPQTIKEMVTGAVDKVTPGYKHERESEAHQIFREQPGHKDKAEKHQHVVPGIEHPGSVGVIYVMDRAMANGFHYGASESVYPCSLLRLLAHSYSSMTPEDWSNFGQGAPETGPIGESLALFSCTDDGKILTLATRDAEGAVPKPKTLDLEKWGDLVHEYGPTTGIQPLRQKVVRRRTSSSCISEPPSS